MYKRQVHFQLHNVLHVVVPAVNDRAFGLYLFGVGNTLFARVIAEQLIVAVENAVIADAEKVQAESPVVDRWNDYMKDILELERDLSLIHI